MRLPFSLSLSFLFFFFVGGGGGGGDGEEEIMEYSQRFSLVPLFVCATVPFKCSLSQFS